MEETLTIEEIKKLTIEEILFNIQMACPTLIKTGENKYHESKYTTLPYILSVLLPIFKKYRVFYSAINKIIDNEPYLSITLFQLDTRQFKTNDIKIIDASSMQKLGSATTYAMRYGLLPMLGLCPEIDDDGNKASGIDDKASKTETKESETIKKLRKLFELKGEVLLQKKQTSYNNLKGFLNGDKDKQMPYNLQLEALKYLESL